MSAWDAGIAWYTERTTAPVEPPLSMAVVQDALRVADSTAETAALDVYLSAAVDAAEHDTQRALSLQTWTQVLSRFPCGNGEIVLERPPLVSVTSVAYYDTDNVAQELAVSPAEFATVPSGAYSKGRIRPLDGATWPATYCRPDAVTVTFQAGYVNTNDPQLQLINAGILLMVGELYKQRTLSVHAVRNAPSVLPLERFWRPVY